MKIPKREEGQGLVEYALILVLVAVIIIAILTILGSSVMVVYARVIGGLNGQVITGTGTEVVVTGHQASVTQGSGGCSVTLTSVSFIGLRDGALLRSTAVNIPVYLDGTPMNPPLEGGSTNDSGTGTWSGNRTFSGSGACALRFGNP